MKARAAWGLLGVMCIAGLGFAATRVASAQRPEFSSFTREDRRTSAGVETTLTLIPGRGVQGISWFVFYRGDFIGSGGGFRFKPQKLEAQTLVYNVNSRFATARCPSGGFLVDGVTMCSKKDASYNTFFDSSFATPVEPRIKANRWVPSLSMTSQAGAQDKNGTQDALVFWVLFATNSEQIFADPPRKFYPFANYYKP